MKKYHLADVLSATEIIMAVVLIIMAWQGTPADYAIWVFVIGELCDAFDGICARRWPYPNDGKDRWWRIPKVVHLIEHTSDIFLAVACMLYLMCACGYRTKYLAFFGGSIIAILCIGFELIIMSQSPNSPRIKYLILIRRWIYIAALAFGIVLLLVNTSWPGAIKSFVACSGVTIGVILVIIKRDRAFKP